VTLGDSRRPHMTMTLPPAVARRRAIRLELPTPALLEPTLYCVYTGNLPPRFESVEPELLYGLLANAKYLLCDSLVAACGETLRAHAGGKEHEAFTGHAAFGPDLVPATLLAQVLDDAAIPVSRRLEVAMSWLHGGKQASALDLEVVRPRVEALGKEADHPTLADLCKRFPREVAAYGGGLVMVLGERLASLAAATPTPEKEKEKTRSSSRRHGHDSPNHRRRAGPPSSTRGQGRDGDSW
jgi:hypothetical protein